MSAYNGRPLAETWAFVLARGKCPICLADDPEFVRYNEEHPQHTLDSWHELRCPSCRTRIGRWSGYFLTGRKWEMKGFLPRRGKRGYIRIVPFDETIGEFGEAPASEEE